MQVLMRVPASVPVPQLLGRVALPQVVNSWTFTPYRRRLNQTQSSSSSFKNNMYAKVLFQRNNMGRPSVGLYEPRLAFGEPRILSRRQYLTQLFLQARMNAGRFNLIFLFES